MRYQFDRILAENPGTRAVVETAAGRLDTGEGWQNTWAGSNWLMRKYLIFKPVDLARPKVCTH